MNQLQKFDVLVIMLESNDMLSRTGFEPRGCKTAQAIGQIKERYEYTKRHYRLVLKADVLPCLNNWRGFGLPEGENEKTIK